MVQPKSYKELIQAIAKWEVQQCRCVLNDIMRSGKNIITRQDATQLSCQPMLKGQPFKSSSYLCDQLQKHVQSLLSERGNVHVLHALLLKMDRYCRVDEGPNDVQHYMLWIDELKAIRDVFKDCRLAASPEGMEFIEDFIEDVSDFYATNVSCFEDYTVLDVLRWVSNCFQSGYNTLPICVKQGKYDLSAEIQMEIFEYLATLPTDVLKVIESRYKEEVPKCNGLWIGSHLFCGRELSDCMSLVCLSK